jgi:hypothetical protein
MIRASSVPLQAIFASALTIVDKFKKRIISIDILGTLDIACRAEGLRGGSLPHSESAFIRRVLLGRLGRRSCLVLVLQI